MASDFIEGTQNPHVKNKLRSYQIKNLKEKQKLRALNFGVKYNPETLLHCDINAIKVNTCIKCGGDNHFIKDCPITKDDTNIQHKKSSNYQNDTNHISTPDKATEPLTKLFNNLLEQLKQLIPAGNNSHSSHSHYKGNDIYKQSDC